MKTFTGFLARAAILICCLGWGAPHQPAQAHGFTADVVNIKRLMNGKYRVIIWYTHLQLGEYRQAHLDYASKDKAIEAHARLVEGADFFLGSDKHIHFHDEPEQPKPF